jgi:hypothetical protein
VAGLDRHAVLGSRTEGICEAATKGEALRIVRRIISHRTGADPASRVRELRRMTVANECTPARPPISRAMRAGTVAQVQACGSRQAHGRCRPGTEC